MDRRIRKKTSKYEKKKAEQKVISQLEDNSNNIETNQNNILTHIKEFYEHLYKKRYKFRRLQKFKLFLK